MPRYTAVGKTPAGTALALMTIMSAAAAHAKLAHYKISCPDTPANLAGEYQVRLITAAPTGGTAVTPTPVDPTSKVSDLTVTRGTYSVQPTWGSVLDDPSINQQATFQWWANPYYEYIAAVGTANGIGFECIAHGGTPNIVVMAAWEE
jgi:hypothetical protein